MEYLNDMEWTNSTWKEGRENDVITYSAFPGSIQTIDPSMVSLLKGLYGKPLNGIVYFQDKEGNNINVFMCNSENIHDVYKNNGYQWAGASFTRAKPGDTCLILPTKTLGKVCGYKFVLAKISK